MTAKEVVGLVDHLEAEDIVVWLDGGWGVDALLEEQTRDHDDLDLVVALDEVPKLEAVLSGLGYTREGGEPPASFELVDQRGRQVDVHPVAFDETGDGLYSMREGGTWVYAAPGFAGTGRVLERRVRCLTTEVQLLCHQGYELDENGMHDLAALRERGS